MKTHLRILLNVTLLTIVPAPAAYAGQLPRPDHVVVVIEENRGFAQMMDLLGRDTYMYALSKRGVLFTQSHGVTHPSQPNYLALFSGSTQGVTDDSCPNIFTGNNLATALRNKGLSFSSYSESMPETGSKVCSSGEYQRKHNPLVNWQDTRLPAELNKTFADFPQDFSKLPTVSFVIPNLINDMHDGSFYTADDWLKMHIEPYVEWAFEHNSLLMLTWDEDNFQQDNRIATILVGPMVDSGVKSERNNQRINHYNVLRTLLDFYRLPPLGESRKVVAIKGIWK